MRVQAAAAGGDGVGGHRRVGRGGAADRHDLADRVVLAELARTRPARPRRWPGTASCVVSHGSLTLTTRVGWTTLPRAVARADHRQHRTDAVAGAERPRPVDALELADGHAARAHQGEQAGLVAVVVLGQRRIAGGVDDALRARGCSRWWPSGRSRRRPPTAGSGSTAAAGCRRRR